MQNLEQRFQIYSNYALNGDNVVNRSNNMPWYEGSTLLHTLENVHIASDHNHIDCRFPVQYVVRPQKDEFHDFRGYAEELQEEYLKSEMTLRYYLLDFNQRLSL